MPKIRVLVVDDAVVVRRMVSDVLASLVNQPARAYDPGSDREPNAS